MIITEPSPFSSLPMGIRNSMCKLFSAQSNKLEKIHEHPMEQENDSGIKEGLHPKCPRVLLFIGEDILFDPHAMNDGKSQNKPEDMNKPKKKRSISVKGNQRFTKCAIR